MIASDKQLAVAKEQVTVLRGVLDLPIRTDIPAELSEASNARVRETILIIELEIIYYEKLRGG